MALYEKYPRVMRFMTEKVVPFFTNPKDRSPQEKDMPYIPNSSGFIRYIDTALIPQAIAGLENGELYGGSQFIAEAMAGRGISTYKDQDVIDVALLEMIRDILTKECSAGTFLGLITEYYQLPLDTNPAR